MRSRSRDEIARAMIAILGASGVKAQQPFVPSHALPGPSPLLHPISILILVLAALGLASTFANMPFELLAARPSKTTAFKATPANPKIPDPTPSVKPRTWMGFLLIACLVVVLLKGPLGLSSGSRLPAVRLSGYAAQGKQVIALKSDRSDQAETARNGSPQLPAPSSLTLESAFYPLLMGAGALLIILEFCS